MNEQPARPSQTGGEDGLLLADQWLQAGRRLALAVVVKTWGSAPRPVGSLLVAETGGEFAGSVSGGCVEAAVIEAALQAIEQHQTQSLEFGVSDQQAWEFGLACGGRISLLIQPIGEPEQLAIRAALAERDQGKSGLLIFKSAPGGLEFYSPQSPPNPDYHHQIASHRSQALEDGGFALLVAPPPRLVVVGAVHIAQELVPLAQRLGFEVVVVDPRQGFATPERFPGVRLIHDWPDEALAKLGLAPATGQNTAVVSMTHEARLDDPALTIALDSAAFYVGALGSKKTQANRIARLLDQGRSPSQTARIHGPVGLNIGAVTASEIAVSILAEIIQVYRSRNRAAERG
ncbi:MAG: XdhC family protein [Alphaproteobacteria bacterium]|nr:XdhC family protein [Alphaproteobacteria bacterium]